MIITNFKSLAQNSLRQKALLITEAGYQAIEIKKTIEKKIKFENNKLFIKNALAPHHPQSYFEFNLSFYKRIFLVGIGKGSALASITLAKILNKRLTRGIALDIQKPKLKIRNLKLEIITGTHPLPSKQNVIATQKIIKLAKNLKKDDLLITFICGGGSALLCDSLKEMKHSILATQLLTRAGANILELNTIRKHLSGIKAGGLAKMAYPATVVSLIISDVLGNDLSMIASGPTVLDKTTKKDAEKILKKYQSPSTPLSALISVLKETPKNKKYFKKVSNILFLSNRQPILAMAEKAKKLGFKTKIYSYSLRGEARDSLWPLIKKASSEKQLAILAAGETTVTLKPQTPNLQFQKLGKGGRNMEAVLGAITSNLITNNLITISLASDGRDNTEAAGAIGDILTIQKAKKLKLKPKDFLSCHDSFNFFKKTKDLIFVEQKTFNISDLMLVLKK